MSRDYISDVPEDAAYSLRYINEKLTDLVAVMERIAVALEANEPAPVPAEITVGPC